MKFQAGFTPKKVDLKVPFGEVNVETRLLGDAEPYIEVVAIREGDEEAAWMVENATVERSGNKLVVKVPERDGGSSGGVVIQRGGSIHVRGSGSVIVGSVRGRTIVNGQVIGGIGSQGVRVTAVIAPETDVKVRGESPEIKVDGALALLDTRTTNGSVQANDHLSDVEIETTNGSVDLEMADRAEIRTTNGEISVGLVREAGRLRTTNGGIHATTATADFTARATNGSVRVYTQGVTLDEDAVSTVNGSCRVMQKR
jgi:hypothetical protein